MIDRGDKRQLIQYIRDVINDDFLGTGKFITRNLINTITIEKTETGFKLNIPARMYSFKEWNKNKAIVPYGNGSYAQRVNVTGGFSGVHKNYVERAIDKAINRWLRENKYKTKGVVRKS